MFHLVYIVIDIQQVQFSQKLEAEYLYKHSEVKWVILPSMSWRTPLLPGVSPLQMPPATLSCYSREYTEDCRWLQQEWKVRKVMNAASEMLKDHISVPIREGVGQAQKKGKNLK